MKFNYLLCLLFSAGLFLTSAQAANQNPLLIAQNAAVQSEAPPTLIPPPPELDASGYVLMDEATGRILAEHNMSERLPPASLTKLMTLYLTFQALKSGQIHMEDSVRISQKAWEMTGSRMFLKVGSFVPVDLLIQGIVVDSGNDACVAIAEYIAGDEATFAALMNQTAERLGMKETHYVDSTGMPNDDHYTTPHDVAILSRAIIKDFPEYYHYFGQKWLTYNNIKQPNRNRLLWRDPSVDGLKTGHTQAAGYCLAASAKRDEMRLVAVVMGTPSDNARAKDAEALLNYGFRFYRTYTLFKANVPLSRARVWMGTEKYTEFGLLEPLQVTIPVGEYKNLKASMDLMNSPEAPLVKGQSYGNIQVTLNGQPILSTPLVALKNDPRGGMWKRLTDHIALFFHGLFGGKSS